MQLHSRINAWPHNQITNCMIIPVPTNMTEKSTNELKFKTHAFPSITNQPSSNTATSCFFYYKLKSITITSSNNITDLGE